MTPQNKDWKEDICKYGKEHYWDFDTPDGGVEKLLARIQTYIDQAYDKAALVADDYRPRIKYGESGCCTVCGAFEQEIPHECEIRKEVAVDIAADIY